MTAERLREVLSYDPETGIFRRNMAPNNKDKAGSQAGSLRADGYLRAAVDGRRYFVHRLAWLYVHGAWPADQLDHINGIRSDNRIANLREASNTENQQNVSLRRVNKSGYPGVYQIKRSGKWQATIRSSGRVIYIGSFPTPELAAAAYREAKEKLHQFHPVVRESNA